MNLEQLENETNRVIDLRRPDPFDKFAAYDAARRVQASGLYPYFRPIDKSEGPVAFIDGREVLMFGSNNYLGLTTHTRVRSAAAAAATSYGTSCTGSRFLNGTLQMHLRLEEDLADWVGKESAVVFSTGMQANLGTISAIADRHSVLLLDASDHASIIDGARLGYSRKTIRFKHQDIEDLERRIDSIDPAYGLIVVIDGVYSMEGDIADLPGVVDVVRRYGARLVVDDAHGIGTIGGGRGTGFHFGLQDQVDLVVGTFSKSLASIGGFVAGDAEAIHYIQHMARSLMFSAALPPADIAAAQTALAILRNEPERVTRLARLSDRLREGVVAAGFSTLGGGTPIVPVVIGDNTRTFRMWRELLERGVYVNAVVSPGVPEGLQLLRMSVMATHEDDQVDSAVETLVAARDAVAAMRE